MAYNKESSRKYYLANHARINERHKAYWAKNKQKYKEYHRKKNLELKRLVLCHYSVGPVPKCACCGEVNQEFLAIDHINGNGNKHRESLGFKAGGGSSFYTWLVKNNFPEDFRVLCHNCNFSIGLYGYCPHGNLNV